MIKNKDIIKIKFGSVVELRESVYPWSKCLGVVKSVSNNCFPIVYVYLIDFKDFKEYKEHSHLTSEYYLDELLDYPFLIDWILQVVEY